MCPARPPRHRAWGTGARLRASTRRDGATGCVPRRAWARRAGGAQARSTPWLHASVYRAAIYSPIAFSVPQGAELLESRSPHPATSRAGPPGVEREAGSAEQHGWSLRCASSSSPTGRSGSAEEAHVPLREGHLDPRGAEPLDYRLVELALGERVVGYRDPRPQGQVDGRIAQARDAHHRCGGLEHARIRQQGLAGHGERLRQIGGIADTDREIDLPGRPVVVEDLADDLPVRDDHP